MTTEPKNARPPQQPTKMSVCGIIGLVLGVLSIVLSFIPIVNNAAAVLGVVGAVLGIIAIVGTFRGKKSGKAIAIVGTVLSVLAVIITLSLQASFSKAIDDATGSSSASTSASSGSNTADAKQSKQDKEGDLDNMHVSIVSAVKSDNDFEGKPTVLVTYEWKNNTDKNSSFMALANAQAFQNGQELDTATYGIGAEPAGYDANSLVADVQPGASGKTTIGYVLKDDSPVTVDVTDLFSLNDDKMVEHKFDL